MPEQDIQGFSVVALAQNKRVEIERLVEQQRHRQVIALEYLPGAIGIATTQLGHVQVGNEAMAGQDAAGVAAGALKCDTEMREAVALSVRLNLFYQCGFKSG